MLIVLRVVFGVAFLYFANQAWSNPLGSGEAGDLRPAFFLAVSIILGLANGAVWAPYIGEKLSDPLTGAMTRSTYVERKNHMGRLLTWLEEKGYHGPARWFCFVEGVRHPNSPTPFIIGMRTSREGSWLEKVYAREVFRFDNAQNCVKAFEVLRRHGIDPRPHRNPEVNIVLHSLERQVRPDLESMSVPTAPPPPPVARNPQIRLFEGADSREEPGANNS